MSRLHTPTVKRSSTTTPSSTTKKTYSSIHSPKKNARILVDVSSPATPQQKQHQTDPLPTSIGKLKATSNGGNSSSMMLHLNTNNRNTRFTFATKSIKEEVFSKHQQQQQQQSKEENEESTSTPTTPQSTSSSSSSSIDDANRSVNRRVKHLSTINQLLVDSPERKQKYNEENVNVEITPHAVSLRKVKPEVLPVTPTRRASSSSKMFATKSITTDKNTIVEPEEIIVSEPITDDNINTEQSLDTIIVVSPESPPSPQSTKITEDTVITASWTTGITAKGSSWRSKAVTLIGQDMLVLGAIRNNPATQLYICDTETLQWSGAELNGEGPEDSPYYYPISSEHADKLFVFWPIQEYGCLARVTHSYAAGDATKLSVKKGQFLIINRDEMKEDQNWVKATTRDDKTGNVPLSCIEFESDMNYHTRLELSVLNFTANMLWSIMTCSGDYLPRAREFFTCTRVGSKIYLFGGRDEFADLHDDMFVLDTNDFRWELCPVVHNKPSPRYAHTMVQFDSNNILVFGGLDADGNYLNDMHMFSLDTMAWTQLDQSGAVPRARAFHTLTRCNEYLVLYGGRNERKVFNDIHIYSIGMSIRLYDYTP
jgi:hypothetical protein